MNREIKRGSRLVAALGSVGVSCVGIVFVAASIIKASLGVSLATKLDERFFVWDHVVAKELAISPQDARTRYRVSDSQLEATFEKAGNLWSIVGANAPIVNPTTYPTSWPVKGKEMKILILPSPITDSKILPHSKDLGNAQAATKIRIRAAPDSYECASFVIRSGDSDLKDVTIKVSDLLKKPLPKCRAGEQDLISKNSIDVRVVKCWYQTGRKLNETVNKVLTPELLLHDDNLVHVNFEYQVNIIRNLKKIVDADTLKPFQVPKHQNRQIWVTFHIIKGTRPGRYTGSLVITPENLPPVQIALEVEVLPISLPDSMLDFGLYYEGHLNPSQEVFIEARRKTPAQMRAELRDMRLHGCNNATLWHNVRGNVDSWSEDWHDLTTALSLRRKIGWENRPLLYLDWKCSFKDNPETYRKKLVGIRRIAEAAGVPRTYIYGIDEASGPRLQSADRTLYRMHHRAGLGTFVAGWIGELLANTTFVDLMVVSGPFVNGVAKGVSLQEIARAKGRGKKVYIYNNPQAGEETPYAYRKNYGIRLVTSKADGALDYAYQTGSCWNDFETYGWGFRFHVMAYPTISEPIPTLQWEGWRAAVNDVRYLTLLYKIGRLNDDWLQRNCAGDPEDCRDKAIFDLSISR